MVKYLRQLAIRMYRLAEQIGNHLLVGRPVQHIALMAVTDAQHLLAVILVPAALTPQLRGLDRGHQHFLRAGRVLLLAHDAFDVLQHAIAERQPGVDAGRGLPHQTGTQHQPMRGDLRLGGRLLHGRDEAARQAHREGNPSGCEPRTLPGGGRSRHPRIKFGAMNPETLAAGRSVRSKLLCIAQCNLRNKIAVSAQNTNKMSDSS